MAIGIYKNSKPRIFMDLLPLKIRDMLFAFY